MARTPSPRSNSRSRSKSFGPANDRSPRGGGVGGGRSPRPQSPRRGGSGRRSPPPFRGRLTSRDRSPRRRSRSPWARRDSYRFRRSPSMDRRDLQRQLSAQAEVVASLQNEIRMQKELANEKESLRQQKEQLLWQQQQQQQHYTDYALWNWGSSYQG